MRRPHGYEIITDPDARGGVAFEGDTAICSHCQYIQTIPPRASPSECGGWCMRCNAFICGPCADRGVCVPWEKTMEKIEARDRFLRSIGLES